MVGMCAVATTQRNWSVGGHLLAQLFVARSRVLSSLQLGAVLIVPWRCIGPASSCTVILLAENGLAPGVSMQVAVYPLHVAVLLRLLGVRGLSPILARSVVVLSISACGLLARRSVQLYSSLSLGSLWPSAFSVSTAWHFSVWAYAQATRSASTRVASFLRVREL